MNHAIAAVACAASGSMISSRASDFPPGEQVAAALLPMFGTQRVGGGAIWSTSASGPDDDGSRRPTPTCPQCGGPHEAHATVCLYCLTPKAGTPEPRMVEVTTLSDSQPRHVPAMQDEYFRK